MNLRLRKRDVVKWLALGVGTITSTFAVLVLIASSLNHGRKPFRMSVRPASKGSLIRFYKDKARSPEYFVKGPEERSREYVLDDGRRPIPGAKVEFYDTTILPGRFKIRIGDTLFDVMESGISMNGIDTDWQPLQAGPP